MWGMGYGVLKKTSKNVCEHSHSHLFFPLLASKAGGTFSYNTSISLPIMVLSVEPFIKFYLFMLKSIYQS